MKKIIRGKLYDTDTAKLIGEYEYNPGSYEHIKEELYQKRTGELFLYGKGGPATGYAKKIENNTWCSGEQIIPEGEPYFDVKEWVSEHCDVETYIGLFGPVSE